MNQISAADRITIDIEPDRWRLITKGDFESQVVAEAVTGQPLRYAEDFASTRRLPVVGALPIEHIQQIVLGWSQRDEAWHLGLVLEDPLAEARGSRWCEIARWPDPDTTVFADLATEAGKTLAQTMSRPFNIIEPPAIPELEFVAPEPVPPKPLPSLPLTFGFWRFEAIGVGYALRHSRRWALAKVSRIAWYTFWVVVYVLLSLATLTSGLALPRAGTMLPNPQVLPYLGLVASVVLAGMVIYQLYQLFTQPTSIVVDIPLLTITASRGQRIHWQLFRDDIKAIYVTQVVPKNPHKQTVYHSELNLLLSDGRFQLVALNGLPEEPAHKHRVKGQQEEKVVPLNSNMVATDVQGIALYIGEALGVPCQYDLRLK